MAKDFVGKNILIVGDGISGKGAKTALMQRGAVCFLFDDAQYSFLPKRHYDLIVISPSVQEDHVVFRFAAENSIPVVSEIEIGYLLNDGKIIAVTGTNGKTTVTQLITEMLCRSGIRAVACGNIGVSFALTAAKGDYDVAVVEVSSFQLMHIQNFRPDIAVITNIAQDHIDRHKTYLNYIKAKLRIAENQTEEDALVLSQDDIPLFALQNFAPRGEVYYTSLRGKIRGAYKLNQKIYFLNQSICLRDDILADGEHNVSNVLSAVSAAMIAGATQNGILSTLNTFSVAAHRIQFVAAVKGKNFYNDSKGTNILATLRAAQTMNDSTCLILGGSDKGYEYDELFAKMPTVVTRAIVMGKTSEKILAAARRNKFYDIAQTESLKDAVIMSLCGEEKNVLLSPASASFDMFSNYKDRGLQFEKFVLEQKEQLD